MPEWRPVPGFEQDYRVSDEGQVWSRPRKTTRGGILRAKVSKRGYLTVALSSGGHQKTYAVHRLVALAFLGKRPDGQEVRHLDGDRLNPQLSNLVYGTSTENHLDKRRHGTDHNAAKTHCPKGHPYSGENLRITPTGRRACRACNRIRKLAEYYRNKAA